MQLEGTVQNGVVIFDNGQRLPEGTRVQLLVREETKSSSKSSLRDRLRKLAGRVDDLPSDMARNHDHYIHGAPKK